MGFGGAAAWMFVREGAKVVLADIDEEGGQKTSQPQSGGFHHLKAQPHSLPKPPLHPYWRDRN